METLYVFCHSFYLRFNLGDTQVCVIFSMNNSVASRTFSWVIQIHTLAKILWSCICSYLRWTIIADVVVIQFWFGKFVISVMVAFSNSASYFMGGGPDHLSIMPNIRQIISFSVNKIIFLQPPCLYSKSPKKKQ